MAMLEWASWSHGGHLGAAILACDVIGPIMLPILLLVNVLLRELKNIENDTWFKQYLFETISHIQYIIFYGTEFDNKLLAYKHHLLDSKLWL